MIFWLRGVRYRYGLYILSGCPVGNFEARCPIECRLRTQKQSFAVQEYTVRDRPEADLQNFARKRSFILPKNHVHSTCALLELFMLTSPYLTARLLGIISLATWCCSLFLPGLSLYSENKPLFGFEILLTGWMSPLMLNFAWFANVFFVFGLAKLLSGGAPSTS